MKSIHYAAGVSETSHKINSKIKLGKVTWAFIFVMLLVRSLFAILSQSTVLGVAWLNGSSNPLQVSTEWWTFSAMGLDLGSFLVLYWLTRKEGIRIRDLIGFERKKFGKDILLGLGLLAIVFPIAYLGTTVATTLIYGAGAEPPYVMPKLPLWAALTSLIVWPITVGLFEELTYNGYLAPRLKALTGKAWLAVVIIMPFWMLQHCFLPFIPDGQYLLFRFFQFLPLALFPIFYLKLRRLTPFIFAHFLLDLSTALSLNLVN